MPHRISLDHITLNVADDGPKEAPTLVLAHSLGLNLHIWDAVLAYLPQGLRIIRYDARGHGGSDVPTGRYTMGQLVTDAERLLEALHVQNAVFVGTGLGGLVAQGLAVKRLDQVRALVLANTAAKIGYAPHWDARIQHVKTQGMLALTPSFKERWFARDMRRSELAQLWADVLTQTNPTGYAGGCTAISGTDFYTPTAGLRLPCLGIAGSEDKITPPDVMRETLELIPGARLELVQRSGHCSAIDAPERMAALIAGFCKGLGCLSQ
jgi:3-oxoadipate enol-lactonase